jgi:nitroreductase
MKELTQTVDQTARQTVSQILSDRYSCRDFTHEPLEPDLLNKILQDAMQSPSWSNTQPYRLAIAQGDTKDKISAELKRRYAKAAKIQKSSTIAKLMAYLSGNEGLPKGDFKQALSYPDELQKRRLVTAKGLYSLLGIERHDADKRDHQTGRNFDFFGAPTVIFIFVHDGLGVYSVLDAGILLQSIMLSAESRGVATCSQGALALWRKPLDDHFAIPENYKLLCGISLGYASEHKVNSYKSLRLEVDELLIQVK